MLTVLTTSKKPHQIETGFDQVSQSMLMNSPRIEPPKPI